MLDATMIREVSDSDMKGTPMAGRNVIRRSISSISVRRVHTTEGSHSQSQFQEHVFPKDIVTRRGRWVACSCSIWVCISVKYGAWLEIRAPVASGRGGLLRYRSLQVIVARRIMCASRGERLRVCPHAFTVAKGQERVKEPKLLPVCCKVRHDVNHDGRSREISGR
jgi:hypothetical protein